MSSWIMVITKIVILSIKGINMVNNTSSGKSQLMDDISAVKRPSNITFYSFNQQSLVKLHCHHQEEAATEKCCIYSRDVTM